MHSRAGLRTYQQVKGRMRIPMEVRSCLLHVMNHCSYRNNCTHTMYAYVSVLWLSCYKVRQDRKVNSMFYLHWLQAATPHRVDAVIINSRNPLVMLSAWEAIWRHAVEPVDLAASRAIFFFKGSILAASLCLFPCGNFSPRATVADSFYSVSQSIVH